VPKWRRVSPIDTCNKSNNEEDSSSKILCSTSKTLASHHEMLLIPYAEEMLPSNNKSFAFMTNILAKTIHYRTTKQN
jgi:hypothetical protein